MEATTIQINKNVLEQLKIAKEYPRQTYNELLDKMSKSFIEMKKRNQYDEFLHKIQLLKIKEIWDNKKDEEWENA